MGQGESKLVYMVLHHCHLTVMEEMKMFTNERWPCCLLQAQSFEVFFFLKLTLYNERGPCCFSKWVTSSLSFFGNSPCTMTLQVTSSLQVSFLETHLVSFLETHLVQWEMRVIICQLCLHSYSLRKCQLNHDYGRCAWFFRSFIIRETAHTNCFFRTLL